VKFFSSLKFRIVLFWFDYDMYSFFSAILNKLNKKYKYMKHIIIKSDFC